METTNFSYTANYEDATEGFDPVPAGMYTVAITEAILKPTKTGGEYLSLKYMVLDGAMKNRVFFENLNVRNQNSKAQEIAYRSLNAIMKSVGLSQIQDTSQLLNRPLCVDVIISDSSEYGKQNKVRKHLPLNQQQQTVNQPINNGGQPPFAGNQVQQPPIANNPQGGNSTSVKPWDK